MCVVSNITDYGRERWPDPWKYIKPLPWEFPGINPPEISGTRPVVPVDQQEVDDLKKEIDSLRDLLKLIKDAQKFDEDHNQPHCEKPEAEKWVEEVEKVVEIADKEQSMKEYKVVRMGSANPSYVRALTWEVRDGNLVFFKDIQKNEVVKFFAAGTYLGFELVEDQSPDKKLLQE